MPDTPPNKTRSERIAKDMERCNNVLTAGWTLPGRYMRARVWGVATKRWHHMSLRAGGSWWTSCEKHHLNGQPPDLVLELPPTNTKDVCRACSDAFRAAQNAECPNCGYTEAETTACNVGGCHFCGRDRYVFLLEEESNTMTVRAKFTVTEKTSYAYNSQSVRIKLTPQYDQSIPEDQRFAKATPSGEFWMQVDNPAAAEALELGAAYYVDLTKAEA